MCNKQDLKKEDKKSKECKSCHETIKSDATVCYHCGQSQKWFHKYFGEISIVTSILVVIFAGINLSQAHKKNIDASNALDVAKVAADNIKRIQTEMNIAKNEIEFNTLIAKALNKDRFAFDELHKIANMNSNKYCGIAKQTIDQIVIDFETNVLSVEFANWDKYGVDPLNASFDDLRDLFNEMPTLYEKIDVLIFIWLQDRFLKAERLEMLHDVITTTPNLGILHAACSLMNEEAKIDKNFILCHVEYEKWWEKNKKRYNNPQR